MIDDETIKKVAEVARISIDEDDISKFRREFDSVLEILDGLDSADVSDIDDFLINSTMLGKVLREDEPKEGIDNESYLRLTKNSKDDYFKGPKAF